MWQKKFEEYGSDRFTVVGLALDIEGIPPAKRYYEKHGVTFPSLVDPNYATRFAAVPKTFFVDEFGVVQNSKQWERELARLPPPGPVPDEIRRKWTSTGQRLDSTAVAQLAAANALRPTDLAIAARLGGRYIDLGLPDEAIKVLKRAAAGFDARSVARKGDASARLLGQAYFQLARASVSNRKQQISHATLAFYLQPTVGFGKQIARLISPEKFDDRNDGTLDNPFREATLRRLIRERREWLAEVR